MCGVVGVWGGAGGLTASLLSPAVRALHHRGPDGSGVWADPTGRAALGHTRLAIVSPEDGAQPLHSEDGQVSAVVNGELYGDATLRESLERYGHAFATGSDSELVVHLYEQFGDAFVDHLRGEFAVILWDARRQRLVAARDRFGVKPLVWTRWQNRVALASEAKALFALGVPARWDTTSFVHAATHQYLPPARTLFDGVHTLPPGHLLIADEADVRVRCYWDLDYPTSQPQVSASEAAEAVREAVDDAIAVRLRADVPVAFALSGGLDSTAIVALAQRHLSEPAHGFCVRFHGAGYDESEHARHAAGALGAVLHTVDVGQHAIVERLPDAVFHSEGLAINGQLTAKSMLAEQIRAAGFKVVLTGEGADELFFGYPHLVADALEATPDAGSKPPPPG